MHDSLIVSLRKYRSREGSDPIEDFITEAFCWLLRSYPATGRTVLNEVVGSSLAGWPGSADSGGAIKWDTQVNLHGKRPDMLATWPGHCVLFEHKVWAELHEGQIESYREALKKPGAELESRIVLITANVAQHNGISDHELCWLDIYRILEVRAERVRTSSDREADSIDDFLALLSHEGLGRQPPISLQAVRYWTYTKNLEAKLMRMFSALSGHDWSTVLPEGYEAVGHKSAKRCVVEFRDRDRPEGWVPGFLFGCLIDEVDHSISHRVDEPMMLRLVVCFYPKDLHDNGRLLAYTSLVDELREVSAADGLWHLYHHLEDPDATDPNRFHPLFLETPLMEVLRGTQTWESQVEVLHRAGRHALSLVQKTASFYVLRENCIELIDGNKS